MKVNLVRRAFQLLAALLFVCTLTATPSKAQTDIVLGLGTSNDALNVTSTGSTIDVSDRTCTGGTCFFAAGSAFTGSGVYSSGTYTMTTGSNPLAFTLASTGTPTSYTVSETNPINFTYASSTGNLTGTLNFLSANNGPVGNGSTSMVFLVGNLAITGGSLASDFDSTPANVTLEIYNSLGSLLNGTSALTGVVQAGNLAAIAPEPSSIFLFGSGLLALGFLIQKKRRQGFQVTSFRLKRDCVY